MGSWGNIRGISGGNVPGSVRIRFAIAWTWLDKVDGSSWWDGWIRGSCFARQTGHIERIRSTVMYPGAGATRSARSPGWTASAPRRFGRASDVFWCRRATNLCCFQLEWFRMSGSNQRVTHPCPVPARCNTTEKWLVLSLRCCNCNKNLHSPNKYGKRQSNQIETIIARPLSRM